MWTTVDAGILPDSFSVRLRISGRGLRDFVLSYPFIFEVVEPEDVTVPRRQQAGEGPVMAGAAPLAPLSDSPSVCVIDSGIQENHVLLHPAVDSAASHCFIVGEAATATGDFVPPGGHGTRVAGAVLYGESIPRDGEPRLPFWIQNARVLDANNSMPVEMFPPEVMRAVVEKYHQGPRGTRIFNHSINANAYSRTRYMSAWAAEIDSLCCSLDVLIVQSAGNLPVSGTSPYLGIEDHLGAGRDYPDYLRESSARVANPGQSLQALTVGSVAYGPFTDGDWKSFASEDAHPSPFSRSGPCIWEVIKPEVVEYGGDCVRTSNVPADVQGGSRIPDACPELVRSTLYPPGPAFDRDEIGTSFAAPKVTRIAAALERILPNEPTLLYRALVVQSARWPVWAENLLTQLRNSELTYAERQQLLRRTSHAIRYLGYGIPDESRATSNTDSRTTLITGDETPIRARECHVYQVPIPEALRRPADEFDVRIDVTLSYVAQPRRTRRQLRRYLSTWVDWKSSHLGEGLNDFRARAIRNVDTDDEPLPGTTLPWVLNQKSDWGSIRDTKRSNGTVQKDWAIVKSNRLPENFCIAVVGHPGWSRDPDSSARYSLAVSLEIMGQEIPIYDPLRTSVIELRAQIEAEVETQVPNEVEVEIEEQ